MGRTNEVLIISARGDRDALAVAALLKRRGKAVRQLPMEEFPHCARVAIRYDSTERSATLLLGDGQVPLESINAVLFRRNVFQLVPGEIRDDVRMFVRLEIESVFRGMVDLLAHAVWVNSPFDLYAFESRLAQYRLAQRSGFQLPRMLVTNDSERARRFKEESEGVVVQSLDLQEPSVLWEEHAGAKVKVFVVGRKIFSGQSLPPEIRNCCGEFARLSGLQLIGIDLLQRSDTREFQFIGCDSCASWSDLEETQRTEITAAVADLLEVDRRPEATQRSISDPAMCVL